MDQMAAEAGVTKPILYRHFGDKAALYEAVAERYVTFLGEALRAAVGSESDPRAQLVAGIDTYISLVEQDEAVYRFLMQRARLEQHSAQAAIENFMRKLGQEFGVVLGEQLHRFELDTGPAEVWGHAIVGAVSSAVDWWVDRPVISRKRLVGYLADLLWSGLTAAAPPARSTPRRTGRSQRVVPIEGRG